MKYILRKKSSGELYTINLNKVMFYKDYSIISTVEYLPAYYHSPINKNTKTKYKTYIVMDTINDNDELLPPYLMPICYEINDKDIKGIDSSKITENTFKELINKGIITDIDLFIDSICKKFKFKRRSFK